MLVSFQEDHEIFDLVSALEAAEGTRLCDYTSDLNMAHIARRKGGERLFIRL